MQFSNCIPKPLTLHPIKQGFQIMTQASQIQNTTEHSLNIKSQNGNQSSQHGAPENNCQHYFMFAKKTSVALRLNSSTYSMH